MLGAVSWCCRCELASLLLERVNSNKVRVGVWIGQRLILHLTFITSLIFLFPHRPSFVSIHFQNFRGHILKCCWLIWYNCIEISDFERGVKDQTPKIEVLWKILFRCGTRWYNQVQPRIQRTRKEHWLTPRPLNNKALITKRIRYLALPSNLFRITS